MSTHDEKEARLQQGYNLLYRTSKELASRFIRLADDLEEDYPLPESLFADLVDLTLEEVVKQTRWKPSRLFLTVLIEQRIRRDALSRAKKAKETIRRNKLKAAAEARRKAKEEAAGDEDGLVATERGQAKVVLGDLALSEAADSNPITD